MSFSAPCRSRVAEILAIFLPVLLLLAETAGIAGPTHEVALSFSVLPQNPSAGPLVAGPGGYWWGTADAGGAYGYGAIYKAKADGSDWQTVLSFSNNGTMNKGRTPAAGLVSDGAGYFWGTTQQGGAGGFGTVFKVSATTGVLTTLVEFTSNGTTNKGATPYGGLTSDGLGFFWGTTRVGGSLGLGTIFKVDAGTGVLTTVLEFTDNLATNKGSYPQAGLVRDDAGTSLWGTTYYGGTGGWGTVFKVNTTTNVLTTMVNFTGPVAPSKGGCPVSPVASDGVDSFWGTTSLGGASNFGTLFKVNATTGALTTLVEFTDNAAPFKGRTPSSGLVRDAAGAWWGTTSIGGASYGTIFKYDPSPAVFTSVIQFSYNSAPNKGGYPSAGLVSDGAGSFLGTTKSGGAQALGTVFRLNPTSGVLTTIVEFNYGGVANRGRAPFGGLVADAAGALWGTTVNGGTLGLGTIFKMDPASGVPTTVIEFTGTSGANLGSAPYAGLVSDGAGSFWGTTQAGGTAGFGTVFKVSASTGQLTTLASFTNSAGGVKGSYPSAGMASDGAGSFWGTTGSGGASGYGTLFKVNASTGALSTPVEFTSNGATNKGSYPYGAVVSDGAAGAALSIWGTTNGGGASSSGTIFKVNVATGVLTTVQEFTGNGTSNKGSNPWGAMVNDGAGSLWGTTQTGGASGFGTIFKVNVLSSVLTTLVEFTGDGGLYRGSSPSAALVSDGAGTFWGTTQLGGAGSVGTVFKYVVGTGVMTTVVQFTGTGAQASNGTNPGYGALIKAADGNFYGTTEYGGPGGGGTIYRVRFGPTPVTQAGISIAYTGAILNGLVNPNSDGDTTVNFEYGTSPTFTGATQTASTLILNGATASAAVAAISGLSPGTTYYSRVRAANAGNAVTQTGASASFTTLVNSPPVVTLTGANPRTIEAAAAYTDPGATAADPEDGALTPTIIANTVLPNVVGTYAVTWQAADSLGGLGSATRVVKVVDTTAPVITPPANVVAEATSSAGAIVTYGAASATDLAGVASLTYSAASGSNFPLGSTIVTVTAADQAGNLATRTFTVTVQDTTTPVVTPPGNILVNATGAAGMVVNYPPATATDAVGVTGLSYSQASGSLFASGTTIVSVAATDAAGHTGTASFTVTVNPPPSGGALSVSPTADLQQGDVVHLAATGWTDAQLPLSYQFFLGASSLAGAGPSTGLDLSAPAPATYTVRVRVTDALGAFVEATQSFTVRAGVASWRQAHFGTTSNTGAAADLADPNGNGIVNLLEYAFHGDPTATTTSASLTPAVTETTDHTLQLVFTRYLDLTDLIFTVTAAASPNGPWTDLATSVGGAPFTVTTTGAGLLETGSGASRLVTVTDLYPASIPLHPRRFIRLKVTR